MVTVERPLTVRELAARYGVHEATIRRWAARGVLPVLRLPGDVLRFEPDAVREFEAARRTEGQP